MAVEQQARKPIWAYAYRLVPPQPEQRLRAVKALLEHERAGARLKTAVFEGRLVPERRITHILVVTDSPDQEGEINRRVEAELSQLDAEFSITAPMAIYDDEATPPAPPGARPAGSVP